MIHRNGKVVRATALVFPRDIDPDSKVHGVNMGPIWGRQDPGGPHVGSMNFAIWVKLVFNVSSEYQICRTDDRSVSV